MTGVALAGVVPERHHNQRQETCGPSRFAGRGRASAGLACPLHCIRTLAPPEPTVAVPLDNYGCVSLEGDYPLKA